MQEERRAILERKRNLLLLIARYLEDHGMANTVESLAKECGLVSSLNDYVLCDNIDLDTVYLDYMSYYRVKFGRPPHIAKRQEAGNNKVVIKRSRRIRSHKSASSTDKTTEEEAEVNRVKPDLGDALTVSQCMKQKVDGDAELIDFCRIRPTLKSFSNYTQEWGELANVICR